MKTFLARAVLPALLVGVGVFVASAQLSQAPTGKDDRAAQEVSRLNGEEVEAFVHNDPKAMARLWSDDLGADPISFGARFGANNRTLPWLQAADSISRE